MVLSELQPPEAKESSLDMETLPALYTFKEREQIRQFLESNPLALTLLQEAPVRLTSLFGEGTSVCLEVVSDPEFPQSQNLWAFILADIGTSAKMEEAEQKVRRLHEEWLIHLPRPLSGSVHFDIEFA